MSAKPPRFGVVGAGIVGLAIARRLTELGYPVTVLDKEDHVAAHQTGHNSGVVHAGLYYQPGSLKATLCRRGMTLLEEYCAKRGLPYDAVGKLVVARDESEVPGLDEIERRSRLNEVPGLRRVSGAEITEIEPHARGVAALHSPHTAIVDFVAVANAYADDLRQAGGEIVFGAEVTGLQGARVRTTAGEFGFDRVVICAGLQSDRVSRLAGDTPGPAIVPFRGEYYKINPDRADLVRGLIYPVPDPRYPFLGVHLTRRIDGSVEVGPNAVLALAREGYTWGDIAPGDLAQTLLWPGFRHMARRHWRTGIKELHGSASKRAFVAAAQSYVPDLQLTDVTRGGAGVRAQAVDADGSLVDDFRIHHRGPVTAIRNAPSPAATSSLAIAEHGVTELLDR